MQRLFGVAAIQFDLALCRSSLLSGIMSPHAGVAVGLQLETHRQRVRAARIRTLHLPHLPFGAGQRLHVVADLVREDVGLREVARRAEAALQLVEEPEIEIDLAIARTVERPGRGARAGLFCHLAMKGPWGKQ